MNYRNLRSSVIRLAHANPELRPHLLPLLGVRTADDKSFDEAIKGKKFKNPETGNEVAFGSLPDEEQKKVRESWSSKNEGGGEKGGSEAVKKKTDEAFSILSKTQPGNHLPNPNPKQRKTMESLVSQGADARSIAKAIDDGEDSPSFKGPTKKLWDLLNEMVG